ncbi:MAG: response regulator [Bdellovibrionales bacterium]|nr:response regulator [Bdellovibrionales bacterium]
MNDLNKQITVLIVDDIPYIRKTLKQILTSHGFRVVGEAENGDEASRLYAETKPDIVTMDLVMPSKNGVQATKDILQIDSDAKIVVLSAMMQENLVTEAIHAGAKDYIVKPFVTEEVLKVLNSVARSGAGGNSRRLAVAGGAA